MKYTFKFLVLAILLVLAGCTGGEVDPRPSSGDLGIHINDGSYSQSDFRLNVTISFSLHVPDQTTFEHVRLCMYTPSGAVLNATDLGQFKTPQHRSTTTISADDRPEYLVVDHPDFDSYPDMGPLIRAWNDHENNYVPARVGDLSFEYPRPDATGVCR